MESYPKEREERSGTATPSGKTINMDFIIGGHKFVMF